MMTPFNSSTTHEKNVYLFLSVIIYVIIMQAKLLEDIRIIIRG